MLTSQTSMRSQRDWRYPKRLEGGKSPSNYNLQEAFMLCTRIQKCLWDRRCTVSGCWKLSAQEKGKAGRRSAQAKGDPSTGAMQLEEVLWCHLTADLQGRWTSLQSLHGDVNSQNCLFPQWITNTNKSMSSVSHIEGWWEGLISCPARLPDWDQPNHKLEMWKVLELESES